MKTQWAFNPWKPPIKARQWFRKEHKQKLQELYPAAPREQILIEFPNHSWDAIVERARRLGIRRKGKHLSQSA